MKIFAIILNIGMLCLTTTIIVGVGGATKGGITGYTLIATAIMCVCPIVSIIALVGSSREQSSLRSALKNAE